MSTNDAAFFTQAYWDGKYADRDRVWSGRPNPRLVEQVSDLPPGTALDIGCGEGADAVWLAERGWRVTGVDISSVALDRARRHSGEAGMADRTDWLQADLVGGDPLPGAADLVTAHYVHVDAGRFEAVWTTVAGAVRRGGTLLVVGHHPNDRHTGLRDPALHHLLFTPEQVTAVLGRGWVIDLADARTREVVGPDERPVTVTDSVVVARRDPA